LDVAGGQPYTDTLCSRQQPLLINQMPNIGKPKRSTANVIKTNTIVETCRKIIVVLSFQYQFSNLTFPSPYHVWLAESIWDLTHFLGIDFCFSGDKIEGVLVRPYGVNTPHGVFTP
jgi:hypothetical protein